MCEQDVKIPNNSVEASLEYLSKFLEGYVKGLQSSKDVNIDQVLDCLSELVSGLVSIKSNLSIVLGECEKALLVKFDLENELDCLKKSHKDTLLKIADDNKLKLESLQNNHIEIVDNLNNNILELENKLHNLQNNYDLLNDNYKNLQNDYDNLQKDFENIINDGDK